MHAFNGPRTGSSSSILLPILSLSFATAVEYRDRFLMHAFGVDLTRFPYYGFDAGVPFGMNTPVNSPVLY